VLRDNNRKAWQHLERNNEYISQKPAGKLVNARYEELVNIKGEIYLKKAFWTRLAK
jgi:hypothetical protein